ncbi:MAG: imelysin family protein [Pseudomonadota bacterium]
MNLFFPSALICLAIAITGCVDDGRGGSGDNGGGGNGGDAGGVPAPAPEPDPIATLERALEQAIDLAIVPAASGFLARSESLQSAAESFCETPDSDALTVLQDQWRATFEQWYRQSLYNFGPMNDDIVFPTFTFIDSLRLRGTDYLETVRAEIASDINGTRELEQSYFANKTFQRVGLLALESAIFETSTADNSTTLTEVLAEYEFQPRKCEVLRGLANEIVNRARYIEQGWTVAFLDTDRPFRELFIEGELEDGTEPISQILIAGQEFLDYLQARRVVTTAAQVSNHAWEAISATIDEVETLLAGGPDTEDSIFEVMADTGNQNAVDAVQESIRQVRQAIADRDVDMLEITLGFLDGNFKREIPDSLDVVLGITFSDGD